MNHLIKSENIKLHKEAQSLMAMYRKELNKTFASMKQEFDAVAEEPVIYAADKDKVNEPPSMAP